MAVPNTATYISSSNNFKIEIQSANPTNGEIEATYSTNDSPVGDLKISGKIGHYAWVNNASAGHDGVAPFVIEFTAFQRPSGRAYAIYDIWSGAYQENNSMILTGTRAYVNEKGVVSSIVLGTQVFSKA